MHLQCLEASQPRRCYPVIVVLSLLLSTLQHVASPYAFKHKKMSYDAAVRGQAPCRNPLTHYVQPACSLCATVCNRVCMQAGLASISIGSTVYSRTSWVAPAVARDITPAGALSSRALTHPPGSAKVSFSCQDEAESSLDRPQRCAERMKTFFILISDCKRGYSQRSLLMCRHGGRSALTNDMRGHQSTV